MKKTALADLLDREGVAMRLRHAGMNPEESQKKAELFRRCTDSMLDQGVARDSRAVAHYVPGRIEILGKHTDYCGGRSMLATPQRGFCVVAVARSDDRISMRSAMDDSRANFHYTHRSPASDGDWANYPMTVARRLARNFEGQLAGANIAFASDLPIAAGMSSSSALVVATMQSLAVINELAATDRYRESFGSTEQLAAYLGCIENGQSFGRLAGDQGVGTFGGSEDHVAIMCAQCGAIKQYSYGPVHHERTIPLTENYVLAVACSGVIAEKTGAAREQYNQLSLLAREILQSWNSTTGRDDPHLAAAVASMPDATDRMHRAIRSDSPRQSDLHNRLDHFLAESEQIIPAVPDQLQANTLGLFGKLVDRSQELADKLLGNQTPETVYLARQARQRGAIASSSFGAGFGGSVWALIEHQKAAPFLQRWRQDYTQQFSEPSKLADFFLTQPGPSMVRLEFN